MGSKPKKSDYQATDAEKTSASVAMAERQYFKEKYSPLLKEMRDESLAANTKSTLRGRASADTMQALSKTSLKEVGTTDSSDMSNALTGQLGIAGKSAKNIKDRMQTSVLGTARGQAADAQTGMATASRMATSEALGRAKNKAMVAEAKIGAAVKVAGTFALQGADNMDSEGGSFFEGKNKDGSTRGFLRGGGT